MFGKRIDLFTLFGFPIRIDLSWFVILVLITWTLAVGYFPVLNATLDPVSYWLMGFSGAIGLFVSVVLHEFAHAWVARRFGLPIHGITLFIFGGVSELKEEPPNAKAELLMSLAGPASSILIAVFFFGLNGITVQIGWPMEFTAVIGYLGIINGILAVFNLIPAFPLDGGRALRSLLWRWRGDLRWATRIASRIGAGFGLFLIVMGILDLFLGTLIGGLWWVLIGLFLRWSAQASYKQLEIQQALSGEPVRRFMQPNPVIVPSKITIADLVNDYFYKYYFKTYPVVDGEKLRGCVSLDQVKQYPHNQWNQHTVDEILASCPSGATVTPETDAREALAIMNQSDSSKLMVTEGDRLVGILTLKDLLQFLSLKMELEAKRAA